MENTSTSTQVPPGFRFHPTDEELVDYYLRRKVNTTKTDLDVIKEVDLYKIEPWDLQEICKLGNEDENEWYFFSHKDKKYPTGTRTNRATTAGFWKATGRDKAIYAKRELVGMRKTLVFYKGRAPNGQKSDWIMHEYRLETDENGPPQEEGWVVCRVFKKKPTSTMRNHGMIHDSSYWYDDQLSIMPNLDSPRHPSQSNNSLLYTPYTCKKEFNPHLPLQIPHQQQQLIHHLPNFLDTSKLLLTTPHATSSSNCNNSLVPYGLDINQHGNATMQQLNDNHHEAMSSLLCNTSDDQLGLDHMTDWRVLDKFVASQLSQDDVPNNKGNNNNTNNNYSSSTTMVSELFPTSISDHLNKDADSMLDNASTSTTSSSQIDAWK